MRNKLQNKEEKLKSKMSYIAGITTFNPSPNKLQQNIEAIVNQVSMVVVVDNGSKNLSEVQNVTHKFDNVLLINNNNNEGIAYAMNQIGEYAYNNGFDWFITLDQDSICPTNMVAQYSLVKDDSVAIVAPYVELNNHFIDELFKIRYNVSVEQNRPHYILYSISSGQMIRTKIWKELGGFWNYLFIDYVDQELCFNATKAGYKIMRIPTVKLDHEPGISVKVLGISTAKQSAMREYYWSRNSRLVYWLYKEQYKNAIGKPPIVSTVKRIANCILVREQVIKKFKAILLGIIDAYSWKKRYLKNGRFPEDVEMRRY